MPNKDPYEVLGIRPSAGSDEIELAYKGRRSQYHPDRYARSDAETQAWATAQMKAINEAYRVLTDPDSRASVDRGRSTARPQSHAGKESSQARSAPRRTAASVMLSPDWDWEYERVFARPNIPRKKLEGAISSYAPGVSPDDVLILLDDTVFGGAKEGLLITNDAIYCKQKFEDRRFMKFSDITTLEPGTNSRVFINGKEFYQADIIHHFAILAFAARLADLFKSSDSEEETGRAQPSTESAPDVGQLTQLHQTVMATLRARFGEHPLLLDMLTDRLMEVISSEHSELIRSLGSESVLRPSGYFHDAGSAELALILLVFLTYYSFGCLPKSFHDAMGPEVVRLLSFIEEYQAVFHAAFRRQFGSDVAVSGDDLQKISEIFCWRDRVNGVRLDAPRFDLVKQIFSEMGLSSDVAARLVHQTNKHAHEWLREMNSRADNGPA